MRRGKGPRRPRRPLLTAALIALALTITACAPAASWLRDRLDTGGGASLEYTTGGVIFDPGATTAYAVHVTLRGNALALTDPANAACEVTGEGRYLDCSLGDVTTPAFIGATGQGVIGSATYTRTPNSIAWQWAYTPTGPTD